MSAANQAYDALASRLIHGRLGTIRAVQLPSISAFLTQVKQLQADEELWKNLPIDELKKQLRIARADFRGIIGLEQLLTKYWTERQHSLRSELKTVGSFLPLETREGLNLLAANISTWGVDAGLALYTEVVEQASDTATGLFFPSNRLTELARNWGITDLLPNGTRVLSRSDVGSVQPGEFERFIVVNSPGALANQRTGPEGPNLLRALFFGARSADVVFVTASNFTRETDSHIARSLIPQDFGTQGFYLEFEKVGIAEPAAEEGDEFFEPVDELMEEFPPASPVQTSDAPRLESGAQSCRLIHLQADLALPVETDSLWVTKLSQDIDGIWKNTAANPFSELREGDLLLAQLDASESDNLRMRARIQMGDQYELFERARERWKKQMKLAAAPYPPATFISKLRNAGIHHAARYEYWLQDDAVGPQSNSDFENVLAFLGFSEKDIVLTMRLTKQWKASLIAEGQRPGREIADYLNREEHDEAFFAGGRAIVLEELGNARFLISPVVSISDTVIQCDPGQVRQVVRTKED